MNNSSDSYSINTHCYQCFFDERKHYKVIMRVYLHIANNSILKNQIFIVFKFCSLKK